MVRDVTLCNKFVCQLLIEILYSLMLLDTSWITFEEYYNIAIQIKQYSERNARKNLSHRIQ